MVQISDEKLCLQWIGFQAYLTSAFGDLRNDKEFTDVTLACEDGQQVEVHKLVLISPSPFFKNLLQTNKHPHPLIYIRGVKSEDLVSFIDFLYQGEANVYHENLESFLAIAEELQIKGLHGNQIEAVPEEDTFKIKETKHAARISNTLLEETDAGGADFKPHSRNSKSKANFSNEPNHETAIALNSSSPLIEIAELREKVKSMMLVSENSAPGLQKRKARICKVCGKEGRMSDIIDHIEFNHITGMILSCNICGKTTQTHNALKGHKFRCHKQ